MRTFAKFSNVNNDHAVRFSHKYDQVAIELDLPVTKIGNFTSRAMPFCEDASDPTKKILLLPPRTTSW